VIEMNALQNNQELVDRFGVVAQRFCSLVDTASNMGRAELVAEIYRILPSLIGEAMKLPNVHPSEKVGQIAPTGKPALLSNDRMTHGEWTQLYNFFKEQLADWDLYRQVFDPTKDQDTVVGSLADDLADIYRDLKEGLVLNETHQASPEDIIWEWRFSFYSHWGKHAIDALQTIHCRISESNM